MDKLDFIITRKLKQVTPYIHFQHDSEGATLRATEVKPKLDKFLLDTNEFKPNKKQLIGDSNALNYKMIIKANGEPIRTNEIETEIKAAQYLKDKQSNKISNINKARTEIRNNYNTEGNHSFYFGNMVSSDLTKWKYDNDRHTVTNEMVSDHIEKVKNAYKESIFYTNDIELQIICFDKDLRVLIDKHIDAFFLMHNFGCRQTKGFGSFIPKELTCKNEEFYKRAIEQSGKPYFYFEVLPSGNNGAITYTNKLDQALTIYSIMKTGINDTGLKDEGNGYYYQRPKNYVKGFAVRPFLPDNTGSEKAFIKKNILQGRVPTFRYDSKDKETNPNYENYTFIRAILGLADHYKFADKARNRIATVTIEDHTDNEEKVQRFPSPVLIKIIDNYVFFIFNDTYKKILGKTFNLSTDNGRTATLTTPTHFDVNNFIKGFIEHYNVEKIKLSNFKNRQYIGTKDIVLKGGNIK